MPRSHTQQIKKIHTQFNLQRKREQTKFSRKLNLILACASARLCCQSFSINFRRDFLFLSHITFFLYLTISFKAFFWVLLQPDMHLKFICARVCMFDD